MYPTGNPEKLPAYYDEIYGRGYSTNGFYPVYHQIINLIEKMVAPRVLEIGCGTGDLARLLLDRGVVYRGFDFSPEGIACCRKLNPEGDFRVADAYDQANYQPFDYNVVVAVEVLEHLDDLRVMANLPAGVRLIASVPDFPNLAHLRVYQNTQTDIIERFRPWVDVGGITRFIVRPKGRKGSLTIYLLEGQTRSVEQDSTVPTTASLSFDRSTTIAQNTNKVGRNERCPCGSGKKYKTCCLLVTRDR